MIESRIAQLGVHKVPAAPVTNDTVSPVDLFITNEMGGIATYIYSLFFGIFAVVELVYNCINT